MVKTLEGIRINNREWTKVMENEGFAYCSQNTYFCFSHDYPEVSGFMVEKNTRVLIPKDTILWAKATVVDSVVVPTILI